MTRQHHAPAPPSPKEATRRRWANKRDHVLRRLDSDPTITLTAKSTARAIAQFSDSTGKPCWPAQETIAGMIGVVPKTIQRAVAELEAAGYVAVRRCVARYKPERRGFTRETNRYTLRLPKGPVGDYRAGQRRRYRSAEWKQRAVAWCKAHRPDLLGDTEEVRSPSEGADPGARSRTSEPTPAQSHQESADPPTQPTEEVTKSTWTGIISPEIEALIAATRQKLQGPPRFRAPMTV